jgi:hypothetical protein
MPFRLDFVSPPSRDGVVKARGYAIKASNIL